MIRRYCKRIAKYIITILSAAIAIFPHNHCGSGKELKDTPSSSPEHPHEEPSYPDYLALLSDKIVPVATGTSTVLTFHEDNSDSFPY